MGRAQGCLQKGGATLKESKTDSQFESLPSYPQNPLEGLKCTRREISRIAKIDIGLGNIKIIYLKNFILGSLNFLIFVATQNAYFQIIIYSCKIARRL